MTSAIGCNADGRCGPRWVTISVAGTAANVFVRSRRDDADGPSQNSARSCVRTLVSVSGSQYAARGLSDSLFLALHREADQASLQAGLPDGVPTSIERQALVRCHRPGLRDLLGVYWFEPVPPAESLGDIADEYGTSFWTAKLCYFMFVCAIADRCSLTTGAHPRLLHAHYQMRPAICSGCKRPA